MTSPGDTIGPYVIESLIAEGGMGAVYRARNRVTGQARALKVIRAALGKDTDFVSRFVREATIASQVRHRYLVETLEPGIDGETIYLPMELLQGETLHARFRRTRRLGLAETARVLVAVCEAVQVLHDRRLIHRDLKPLNIFLAITEGQEGTTPKVLDLGTARSMGDEEHTATGMVVGSPHYMAPEQAEGRRDLSGAVDQYSLGVIAYQLLTGQRPYESDDTRSALAKLLRGEPIRPMHELAPNLPSEVEGIVLRALSRDPAQRYPRVSDLGAALASIATTHADGTPSDLRQIESSEQPLVEAGGTKEPSVAQVTHFPVETPPPSKRDAAASLATPAPALVPPTSSPPWRIAVVAGLAIAALGLAGWQFLRSEHEATVVVTPPPTLVAPIAAPTTVVALEVPSVPEAPPPAATEIDAGASVVTTAPHRPHRPPHTSTTHDETPVCGAATGIPCID